METVTPVVLVAGNRRLETHIGKFGRFFQRINQGQCLAGFAPDFQLATLNAQTFQPSMFRNTADNFSTTSKAMGDVLRFASMNFSASSASTSFSRMASCSAEDCAPPPKRFRSDPPGGICNPAEPVTTTPRPPERNTAEPLTSLAPVGNPAVLPN